MGHKEDSNANKQLRIIDENNQYNMRTAEETATLALFLVEIKKRLVSAVLSCRKLAWIRIVVIGNTTDLITLLKL